MTLASEEVCNYEGFELALAKKLIDADARIVCNDFFLKGKERIIVVNGLNQGGKTTFARSRGRASPNQLRERRVRKRVHSGAPPAY
jgi:DNA mismatch repair ATPase MutS